MIKTNQPPASRRELSKLCRRQAIIDAARASFLHHGYADTSMSSLLMTLGGSKGTLWRYFRSKDELFAAVIEDLTRSFRAEVEGVLSPECDLESTLVEFCRRFIGSPDALATWRLVMAESGRFPEIERIFNERAAGHTHTALSAFLARHVASGNLSDDDPARMADVLTSLCVGRQTRRLWCPERADLITIDNDAVDFTCWFLRAYAPRIQIEDRRLAG